MLSGLLAELGLRKPRPRHKRALRPRAAPRGSDPGEHKEEEPDVKRPLATDEQVLRLFPKLLEDVKTILQQSDVDLPEAARQWLKKIARGFRALRFTDEPLELLYPVIENSLYHAFSDRDDDLLTRDIIAAAANFQNYGEDFTPPGEDTVVHIGIRTKRLLLQAVSNAAVHFRNDLRKARLKKKVRLPRKPPIQFVPQGPTGYFTQLPPPPPHWKEQLDPLSVLVVENWMKSNQAQATAIINATAAGDIAGLTSQANDLWTRMQQARSVNDRATYDSLKPQLDLILSAIYQAGGTWNKP